MRNSMKVAKWEIKRNLKNKSFVIGLFLTPLLILAFGFLGSLFGSDSESTEVTIFVNDQLNVFDLMEETADQYELDWILHQTNLTENEIQEELKNGENTAYIFLNSESLESGAIPVYTTEDIPSSFSSEVNLLAGPLQQQRISQLDLTDEELAIISTSVLFEEVAVDEIMTEDGQESVLEENPLEKIVPGLFAGIILFSIVITGMMIFQSASQEKKDKIAEIILSSVTPSELMNGKIIGYFVLGIIQVVVLLLFVVPFAAFKIDEPVMEYLLVPETLLLVLIAILGYLLFASIFVGIGATMADMSTSGNFQGLVMMLPFLSFVLIAPVLSDPSGLVAKVASYIPFTSPGVLIMRLTVLEEWPWIEILIALAVLLISIFVFMKLAGKIFKVGILMYGKNATPGEIWKWIRS
ncbi:ABC transporter permease [Ornithinibacillus massiliensis]|uniref:ABC transporter permease n=1 Tax=Ornithinibacillus massiliensis TaxID=1944633 RepID=A0ABS5MAC4_9BACI|nr:ABC transporter permease [Ornithinibacillus massiliensis]MBS3679115.1 ABC transporter permease [Ornithinibacillus massiliensis]